MFSSPTDHIANAAKLLTASAAFVASPGLKSGASIYDAAKKVFKAPPQGLTSVANEITDLANGVFQGFARDLPGDAPVLFEQMVAATLPDAAIITKHQMNATKVAKDMRNRLKDKDHQREPMPDLFVAIVAPAFEKLFADKDFAADLTPAINAQLLDDTGNTRDDVSDMKAMMQDLLNGKYISLDILKTLAANFGEHDITDQHGLENFLKLRAEENSSLRQEIDAIDPAYKHLSNLKAAAQEAIDRYDHQEVERLLSAKHKMDLEEAAKTAELRARNALLRGDVELAYRLLSAAADSFAAVDPLEPARKRILSFFVILRDHGRRFGGAGLSKSIELLAPALSHATKTKDAWLWAAGENWRGVALSDQGTRTEGQAGADLLANAVAAFHAALELRTRADHPVD